MINMVRSPEEQPRITRMCRRVRAAGGARAGLPPAADAAWSAQKTPQSRNPRAKYSSALRGRDGWASYWWSDSGWPSASGEQAAKFLRFFLRANAGQQFAGAFWHR